MKRSLLLLSVISISIQLNSQIIKGSILDSSTKNPIPFAVAYFDGTSIATYADDKGSFQIDARKIQSMPLVFSALGYFSSKVVDYSPSKEIIVYLTPKTFELSEVSVATKGNPRIRRRNLARIRLNKGRWGNIAFFRRPAKSQNGFCTASWRSSRPAKAIYHSSPYP